MEKADILTFLNAKLHRNETDIDVDIQTALNDLSSYNFLTAEDTTQTLALNDTYLTYPSLYKDLVSIVLNDGSTDGEPLKPLARGYREYLELMENPSLSEPEWYAEYEGKFYLYPVAGASYTVVIKFYKFHAQDVDSIDFGEEFRNCIFWGTAFFYTTGKPLSNYRQVFGALYEAEKEKRRLSAPTLPYICRG